MASLSVPPTLPRGSPPAVAGATRWMRAAVRVRMRGRTAAAALDGGCGADGMEQHHGDGQRSLAAVAGHYQRQIADLTHFVKSKFPDEQELPPSLFAAPLLPVPPPVHAPAQSAGSNPTSGASPPPGLFPQHPTNPTQLYTWAPPSQTYSSWPGAQTQRGPRPPYWHYDPPQGSRWTQAQPQPQPQSGWCVLEQGGGAGTSGDGATS